MTQEYLLDSNILIYLAKGNQAVKKTLNRLRREYFFISAITTTEVLVGVPDRKEFEALKALLTQFVSLDLRREISEEAALLYHKNSKKLKFKDLLIAATAKNEKLTLITADKDFKTIKGLKVKLLKLNER